MPRYSRIDYPGLTHHVISRGIERRKIFSDKKDYERFISIIEKVLRESPTTVCYAWALMPNHFHLLVTVNKSSLSSIMRRLLTRYATYFNARHKRRGHLFQNRYKSIVCQKDEYFLQLVRYIHLNPLKAKIVTDIDELNRYPYTGHSAIMGYHIRIWQNITEALDTLTSVKKRARERYKEFISQGIDDENTPNLEGGGFLRLLDIHKNDKQALKEIKNQSCDERILGSGEFVDDILSNMKHESTERKSFDSIVKEVSSKSHINPKDVYSRSKTGKICDIRASVSYKAARNEGYTVSEIAKKLNISRSGISRAIERGRILIDTDKS
jgi:REP element-mobilizing transposase RayT/DNA invertase Pin-like site-specific DNA recombinase